MSEMTGVTAQALQMLIGRYFYAGGRWGNDVFLRAG